MCRRNMECLFHLMLREESMIDSHVHIGGDVDIILDFVLT